jgi:hypothetical protein
MNKAYPLTVKRKETVQTAEALCCSTDIDTKSEISVRDRGSGSIGCHHPPEVGPWLGAATEIIGSESAGRVTRTQDVARAKKDHTSILPTTDGTKTA